MNFKHRLLIFLFLVLSTKYSYSQYLEFVENKGQWADNIAYKGEINTGAIALKPDGGYRMLQHNQDDLKAIHQYLHPEGKEVAAKAISPKKLGLHSHVYEVSFLGCNPTPTAISEKPQDSYNNYFIGNDKTKWASGCKIFQAVTYKNIYPNIDVRYYTGNGTLKYDFIVNPGGNPNQIALVFDGTDELKIKKGKLIITTSVTEEKELAPYTFQPSPDGKKEVDCSYHLNGNIVTFKIDDYDKTKPLIIDPTKVFATFTGSRADNWGFTATYDDAGNFYAGGVVFGTGFPISNGSRFMGGFQDNPDGVYIVNGTDMGIIKFNSEGSTRLYATYIGGSNGNEQPHSMIVDNNGDLVIAGRTNSNDYPTTHFTSGIGGGKDIIITKLNNLGNLIASKKIGGSGDDGMNIKPKYSETPRGTLSINRNYGDDARSEVIVDENNNILLASCTQSTDFFVTPNAFQATNGGASSTMVRKQDAVFIKLSNDLNTVITSTYFGGSKDEAAFVLSINPINKNIYIAGGTSSNDLPGDHSGMIQENFQGGDCDGFIAIIDGRNYQILKSGYFGTVGSENIYGIQFDKKGFPYMMGTTTGQWQIFNAIEGNPGAKQFIAKLQPDLSAYVYTTTFGTSPSSAPNISPTAFLVDRCERVYVSGWGGAINSERNYFNSGTSNMTTKNAMQESTDGSDLYFYVLERDAKSQLYGDFFGQNKGAGEHVDGGTSRFDKNGIIYQSLCANCGGPSNIFPTTPGAYSRINGAENCNLAAVKIAFNLSGVGSGVRSSIKGILGNKLGCAPLTVNFVDTLAEGAKYYWNFGEGGSDIITVSPNNFVSYTYNQIIDKDYVVRLVSEDSSTCNVYDTSYVTIKVRIDSAILDLQSAKVGGCFSDTFSFDTRGSKFVPTKPFKSNSFLIDFGDGTKQFMGYEIINHKFPGGGIYYGSITLLDTNYCNTPQVLYDTIRIVDNVKASFTSPSQICLFDSITCINQSKGFGFKWYINNVFMSDKSNFKYLFPTVGTYTIKLVVDDAFSCNKIDSIEKRVTVVTASAASFTYTPKPTKINKPVTFKNTSLDGVNYKWTFGDGDSLITKDVNALVVHTYQQNKKYQVCLYVENKNGCIGVICDSVLARVNPLFDVPNALAPEGKNNKIFVKGYGIKSINWNIYNRWGILVFSTNNINDGWDGKYKGEIQPIDVYHYTLQVNFYDGKKDGKTGDITLVR
jgi:gliding motility-associated-like protein